MIDDLYWHLVDEDEVHDALFTHVKAIQENQSHIEHRNRELAAYYSNRNEPGIHGARSVVGVLNGVRDNIIKNIVDTSTTLIAKTTPKTTILTNGGDWSVQRTAKNLDKYVRGQFSSLDVYRKMKLMFRDAAIFGTGFVYVYRHKGKICVDRVLPTEMVVDERTCRSSSNPLEMYRVRFVHRDVLISKYPNKKQEILESGQGIYETWETVDDKQMVLVVEAWRRSLPGQPGRYAMITENCTLEASAYNDAEFPFVVYRYFDPITGFYGQSLAEILVGHQVRLDDLNDFIQEAQDKIAVPRVFMPAGSKITSGHIDNAIGRVIPYNGERAPTFFTPEALTAEVYNERVRVIESAYKLAGISEMSAFASRPVGIESGIALQNLSDNQTQRLGPQQQEYEIAHVKVAELIIREASRMSTPPKAYMSGRIVEEIDWPAVDFDDDTFVFDIQPSSLLGETPAAKIQRVIEFAQYGVPIRPDVMQRLLAHPDIQLEDERSTAAIEHAEWVADKLLDGEYVEPDSFMDLALTLDRVIAAMLLAARQDAPQDILENCIQFVTSAQQKIVEATAQVTPQMAEAGGTAPMAGNIEDSALPGVVDPSLTATGDMLPGLIENSPLTTG